MTEKIIAILLLHILLGILVNTIVRTYEIIQPFFMRKKSNEKVFITNENNLNDWETKLEEKIFLNSIGKWYVWLFTLAMCVLVLVEEPENLNMNNTFVVISMGLVLLIIFSGIISFLHNSNFKGVDKISIYFIKIAILSSFTIAFMDSYLRTTTSIWMLFISILIPIIFSFMIMKSVIDSFNSYVFQVFNFILLILIFNIFYIGFNFGIFYGINNGLYIDQSDGNFIFFEQEEVDRLNNTSWELNEYLLVIYKGIKPFYSIETVGTKNGIMGFVPFIEFIIGNIYNLTVIAFFVSYSVSKLINRQDQNTNQKLT